MAWLRRFLPMALVWLVLSGGQPDSLVAGALAAAVAATVSLRLQPRADGRFHLRAAARLLVDFARGSLAGGVDVARRALDPRLPLRPGWVRHPVRLAPGMRRMWLGDFLSLMPGSLAAGDDGGRLFVHCLDTGQDVEAALAQHEAKLRNLFGDHEGDAVDHATGADAAQDRRG